MLIKQHCILMFVSQALLLCGAFASFFFLPTSRDPMTYFVVGGFIAAMIVNQLSFLWFIPAYCPKCGERARLETTGTYKYKCTGCRHVHDTGISTEGD
jgi:hypothetical protein